MAAFSIKTSFIEFGFSASQIVVSGIRISRNGPLQYFSHMDGRGRHLPPPRPKFALCKIVSVGPSGLENMLFA